MSTTPRVDAIWRECGSLPASEFTTRITELAMEMENELAARGNTLADKPQLNSLWLSKNGHGPYRVVGFANEDENPPKHICHVIYDGENGKKWCRTLADFEASMVEYLDSEAILEIPTPETDAALCRYEHPDWPSGRKHTVNGKPVVLADKSRDIERRLTVAREALTMIIDTSPSLEHAERMADRALKLTAPNQ